MSDKPSIADFVATDDSGGFVNLKTGEVLDAGAMLRAQVYRAASLKGRGHAQIRWTGYPVPTRASSTPNLSRD